MNDKPVTLFKVEDFIPGLREKFEAQPLPPDAVPRVGFPIKSPESTPGRYEPALTDRRRIMITDGKLFWMWEPDSLRGLFRGDNQPPALGAYPQAYNDSFMILDLHVLEVSRLFGDVRDLEMLEIFSALRRRPDGRSMGFLHDYIWQAAALVLGTRPLSQAEFEAIMARLERSCRTFEEGPGSRNYAAALRTTFGRARGGVS